ncbi:MAG: hypothetical protein JJE25_12990, partial [Bacteroidia bacterium]|nr:hypothetical protein [Bacteroidia bacterium]
MDKNYRASIKRFFVSLFILICISFQSVNACNYSSATLVGTPVDNGNGTYTINVQICIAITISWGGTTNFSIVPAGNTFTSISSFGPATLTSTYNYCSQCTGPVCTGTMTAVTATATGTLNGPQSVLNFNQTSSTPATGCTPPAACWGSGFPFMPDDYQAACVTNSNFLCWTITLVTNGYPSFITLQGTEDDIGPDVASAGNPGCPHSVVLPALPCNPGITVSPNVAICSGQSTILTASGANNYSWTPTTGLSSSNSSSVTASPTSTTTYTVTGNPGGCTAQVTVTVNPLPVVTVTPNTSVCAGQSVTLTASGANTYSWSPPTGLSSTTGSTVTATPILTTTYTVTGTSASGCTRTAQVTVTVNPLPVVTITPPAPICPGQSATLTANGASTYSWSPATNLSSTTGSPVIATPTSTTTYTVTGTSNGCTATAQVTVTINPVPLVTVSPPPP